jgi:hypothetical protein
MEIYSNSEFATKVSYVTESVLVMRKTTDHLQTWQSKKSSIEVNWVPSIETCSVLWSSDPDHVFTTALLGWWFWIIILSDMCITIFKQVNYYYYGWNTLNISKRIKIKKSIKIVMTNTYNTMLRVLVVSSRIDIMYMAH